MPRTAPMACLPGRKPVEGERDLDQEDLAPARTPVVAGAEHQARPGQRARAPSPASARTTAPMRSIASARPLRPLSLSFPGALFDREGEHVRQAPDAAVLPYSAEEGLRGEDPVGGFLQIGERQQQQPVTAEERLALRVERRAEQVGPTRDLLPHISGRRAPPAPASRRRSRPRGRAPGAERSCAARC